MATLAVTGAGLSPESGLGFASLDAGGWTLQPLAGAASTVELKHAWADFRMVLDGSFTPGTGDTVNGTLGGISVYHGADLVYRLANIPAQDAAPFLDFVLHHDYTAGLRDAIFAGNDTVMGSALGDTIYTGAGKDLIDAGAGNDVIDAGPGNDTIDGGDGIDSANPGGALSNFLIERSGGVFTLTNLKDGSVDIYRNVEILSFGRQYIDTTIDVDNTGGQVFRMYQAAFDRTPDQLGLSFWTGHLGKDLSLDQMADEFIKSWEYQQRYAADLGNRELVSKYYENVLHRAPDQGGLDYWTAILDSGHATRGQVLASISESPENIEHSAAILAHGAVIDYFMML